MRRWILPTLVLALGLGASVGPVRADDLREQSSRDWDRAGLESIEVTNARGLISIRPSADGRVRLVALKIVHHGESTDGAGLARATRVETGRSDGRLWVRVKYPQRREIHIGIMDLMRGVDIAQVEVRLALEVPADLAVSLQSASGDLESDGLRAPQRLEAVSGDVSVAGAEGPVTIETSSGDAHLDDVIGAHVRTTSGDITVSSSRGPLALSTASGDVNVDSAADSLEVSSTSGEVRIGVARRGLTASAGSGDVTARAAGHVSVETTSGDANVTLIAPWSAAEVLSSSGDVTLLLPTPADCVLEAETSSGSLDVRVPIHPIRSSAHRVTGTLGRGGKARAVVRTASGSAVVGS